MPKPTCPNCNSTNTCNIMYGLPDFTPELEQKLAAGEVLLGGCVIEEDSPNRHCNECELDFDTNKPNTYSDVDGDLKA